MEKKSQRKKLIYWEKSRRKENKCLALYFHFVFFCVGLRFHTLIYTHAFNSLLHCCCGCWWFSFLSLASCFPPWCCFLVHGLLLPINFHSTFVVDISHFRLPAAITKTKTVINNNKNTNVEPLIRIFNLPDSNKLVCLDPSALSLDRTYSVPRPFVPPSLVDSPLCCASYANSILRRGAIVVMSVCYCC